ncbi:MAG TPA: sugar ABC transporter permease [Chloroflexota bacterium]|nr:sugar ABC transporter permease [Chloroflexota bacterium]
MERSRAVAAVPVPRAERRQLLEAKRIFILPAVGTALLLSIFPMLFSIAMVFMKLDLVTYEFGFNGLRNITRLFSDAKLLNTVLVTARFVVTALPAEYLLGLGLALLLNQKGLRGARFFRVYFVLPMMLSPVAVSYDIGQMLFHETRGPVNQFLRFLGLPPVHWLSDPAVALNTLIIIDIWQWTPFVMLLMLAALQSIPDDVYDAVRVDGASSWQAFRYVVFPLIAPITATALLIRGLEAIKVFETIYVVTGGGPGVATESITLYAFQIGFKNLDLGYAATIAQVLLILIMLAATLYIAVWRRIAPETTY